MKILYTFILLFITTTLVNHSSLAAVKTDWQPYGFWENKGQVTDQDGNPRADVLYLFEQSGFTIALGKDFFSYQLAVTLPDPQVKGAMNPSVRTEQDDLSISYPSFLIKYERTDIKLAGASKNVKLIAQDASGETRNYYNTAGSFSGIHYFQKIIYENIYPDIDLVFYIQNDKGSKNPRLKYDFIIHPGGDVSKIQLEYAGPGAPSINENGELVSLFPQTGFIKESKPLCYFQSAADSFFIPYQSNGSTISFKPVKAVSNRKLTIDPEINWSLYLGGNKNEFIEVLEVDGSGNIYCSGQTFSFT
ncbi:MAG TPA: hypothetical protein PLD84_13000, partial [Chitinophagales bacterium]|nr:hypothetical protein [Chitinophagales bacterium]